MSIGSILGAIVLVSLIAGAIMSNSKDCEGKCTNCTCEKKKN